MPFPNEHAARLKSPGKYIRFRRQKNKGGPGVDFIFGVTKEGKTEIQAVRFAKTRFTVPEAKAWLKRHKMEPIMFEPAKKTDHSDEYVTEEFRYDKGEVRSAEFDQDGFLMVDAVVTRTGVFNYRNGDGSLRRELRHPDDIYSRGSLRTLSMLPITLLHPPEKKVDSNNITRLQKGFTGSEPEVDGKYVRARLKVCDQEAIDSVLGGMRELSLGYTVALVEEDGEYMGERYDFRQTDVVYNHLAIVPQARAGAEARIVLDEADAVQCMTGDKKDCGGACDGDCTCQNAADLVRSDAYNKKPEGRSTWDQHHFHPYKIDDKGNGSMRQGTFPLWKGSKETITVEHEHDIIKFRVQAGGADGHVHEMEDVWVDDHLDYEPTQHQPQPTNKENRMKKITIDGIEYDAAPEVANKLAKETERADKAEGALEKAGTEKTELQAKLDEANEKVTKAEARDDQAEIRKAVDARLALVAQATPHLDEETTKKVADMSDKDIKVAVIKKHYPEANLDEKDDVYIDARYDGAIELDPKGDRGGMADQRRQVNGDKKDRKDQGNTGDEPDQEKSRSDMEDDLKNSWKGKTGTDDK